MAGVLVMAGMRVVVVLLRPRARSVLAMIRALLVAARAVALIRWEQLHATTTAQLVGQADRSDSLTWLSERSESADLGLDGAVGAETCDHVRVRELMVLRTSTVEPDGSTYGEA